MSVKSRIEHLVKFNQVANRVFTRTASFGVSCLGLFAPVKKNLMLFVSDIGKNYTGSPRALYEYMKDNRMLENMEVVWAFVHPEKYSGLGCKVVKLDSIEYFRIALQAKYWITDVNIERGLTFKRKQTIYLNTWHGSSLKTLGWDIHGRIYYDCSNIDILCASSEYDVNTFSKAFRIEKSKIIRSGLPRNDQLYKHRDDSIAIWKKRVGLPIDKTVILYAPTWRDTIDGGSTYSIEPPIDVTKWRNSLGDDYVLVFRMHPITQKALGIESDGFILDYSNYNNLNDLMLASDILITDYSSIAIDYAILKRPIVCFAYDKSEYERARGLYLDVSDVFPRGNCEDDGKVLEEISNLRDWQDGDFAAPVYTEFNEYGGNSCEVCCKALFNVRSSG